MTPTELLAFILEISAAWFGVAGIGYFFFMRWRRRERAIRASKLADESGSKLPHSQS